MKTSDLIKRLTDQLVLNGDQEVKISNNAEYVSKVEMIAEIAPSRDNKVLWLRVRVADY